MYSYEYQYFIKNRLSTELHIFINGVVYLHSEICQAYWHILSDKIKKGAFLWHPF